MCCVLWAPFGALDLVAMWRCSGAFPFALTRLFFQALNQPIKIHVHPGLCAEGDDDDAALSNFTHKQHATRDLLRRLQQQGRLIYARPTPDFRI
jgi:hypothetical protein